MQIKGFVEVLVSVLINALAGIRRRVAVAFLPDLARYDHTQHLFEWGNTTPAHRSPLTCIAASRLTAVNIISSQVAGVELNRGQSASSDQIGLVGFFFSFLFLFAFCNFPRRSYDAYMTLT